MTNVELKISTYRSKGLGYQSKKGLEGKLTLFVSNIYDYSKQDFNLFVKCLDYVYLLERICLERAFQKIRMKERCKKFKGPFSCKMDYIVWNMIWNIDLENILI